MRHNIKLMAKDLGKVRGQGHKKDLFRGNNVRNLNLSVKHLGQPGGI